MIRYFIDPCFSFCTYGSLPPHRNCASGKEASKQNIVLAVWADTVVAGEYQSKFPPKKKGGINLRREFAGLKPTHQHP
jgi:hypothetical protein